MRCGSRSRVNGFSLIEVIASLMLVGILLVLLLQAHRDSARQLISAQKRMVAVELLDELLSSPEEFVLQEPTGKVPGNNPLYWRTTPRADTQADQIGAMIMRVELYDPDSQNSRPLASVELLAPGNGFSR